MRVFQCIISIIGKYNGKLIRLKLSPVKYEYHFISGVMQVL